MTMAYARPSADTHRDIDDSDDHCAVSVIVPVATGDANLGELYTMFASVLELSGRAFEFIVAVTPESIDRLDSMQPLIAEGAPVRIVHAAHTLNETALLRRGSRIARGDIIVALPPQHQVEPSALESLLDAVERGADVAVARRWPRNGPFVNRAQSWLLHRVLGNLGGRRFHDLGCGVRAMRRQVLRDVPLYGELSRFFPLLAHHQGFTVEEVTVAAHPVDRRLRVHSPGVYVRRLLDVLGVFFVLRFTDRPLRFFGLIGTVLGVAGSAIMVALLIGRANGTAVATRPLLLLGALFLALGLQSLAFGLIGEMIVHFNAGQRRFYRVKEIREQTPE